MSLTEDNNLNQDDVTIASESNSSSEEQNNTTTVSYSHNFDTGVFLVGETGEVRLNFLYDGGSYKGEVAFFSLDGMGEFEPGSSEFIQEAARRALTNSELGYVVIKDATEGAKFTEPLGDYHNDDAQNYSGSKTFAMRPGDEFGVMLVPSGKVQEVFDNPDLDGSKRPLFSLATANPEDRFQMGQIADLTGEGSAFAMEDLRIDVGSDGDYNDIIFQVTGAVGTAVNVDEVINPETDWRKLDAGEDFLGEIDEAIATSMENNESTDPAVDDEIVDSQPDDEMAGSEGNDSMPETVGSFESGFFVVGNTGQINLNFLYDGGGYNQGEVAIFNIEGMEDLEPGSEEFIKEAARRSLSHSELGHVVISDAAEGAQIDRGLGDAYNYGEYAGVKTFSMTPGSVFAVMLVPNGKVQEVFDDPSVAGAKRPLFSLATANPDDTFHVGQMADITGHGSAFVMEDLRVDSEIGSDRDYNDIIFQITGATGKAVALDDLVEEYNLDQVRTWRDSEEGQTFLAEVEQVFEDSVEEETSQDSEGEDDLEGSQGEDDLEGSDGDETEGSQGEDDLEGSDGDDGLPENIGPFESGFFIVGDSGEVEIDYLYDGGAYKGEVAIFSIAGMEEIEPGSLEFIAEATRRSLSNSELGHVVIQDPIEGAKLTEPLGDYFNYDANTYQGVKTFAMNPGDAFGVMLVPSGTLQEVLDNPEIDGAKRPLFSLTTANPDDAFQIGQLSDLTGNGNVFAMEDLRIDRGSDLDYNDVIFRVSGATGKAVNLDEAIAPDLDWRNSEAGQEFMASLQVQDAIAESPEDDAPSNGIQPVGEPFIISFEDESDEASEQPSDEPLVDETINGEEDPELDDASADDTGEDAIAESVPGEEIMGDENDNAIAGTDGDDNILGMQGEDVVEGSNGDDVLNGNEGEDVVAGGAGDDVVHGGKDNDTVIGGEGNDEVCGDLGDDIGLGLDGTDSVLGGEGSDHINGNKDDDFLNGNQGEDTVYGGQGDDILRGGKDNDILYGDLGDDVLYGDLGNDTLTGGFGEDVLIGGQGEDVFVLAAGSGMDSIVDFVLGEDRLGLSGGLSFEQLTITQGSEIERTIVQITETQEVLATLTGVGASEITSDAFTLI